MKIENITIGYDAKRAVCNRTGIGNYSRALIECMASLYPRNKYILYSPKLKESAELSGLLEHNNVSLYTPGAFGRKFGSVWRSLELTRQLITDDVNVYHGLSNELPLNIARSGIPSVVTIHDVIWRRLPQNYSTVDRYIYDTKYKLSAQNATRIIAISQRTKEDIVNDFGVSPEKVDVVYQMCNPIFNVRPDAAALESVKTKYNLPELYILSVGTIEYRKNQLLAVESLLSLPEEVHLVLVGHPHKSYYKEITAFIGKHHLEQRVKWLKDVPNSDLPALYSLARLSSYPSRYEGFGLPIVESLSVGTPVIAATGSCLEEAGGRGAIYVDPDNVEEYSEAAKTLIYDNYRYHKYADQGKEYVRRFNAAQFAKGTMQTYLKAILEAQ